MHSKNAENFDNFNSLIPRGPIRRQPDDLAAGRGAVTITDSQAEQRGPGLFTFQSSHCWADASGNILLLQHMRVMRVLSALTSLLMEELQLQRKEGKA